MGDLWGIPYWGWGLGAVAIVGGWWIFAGQSSSSNQQGADQYGNVATGSIALSPPLTSESVGGAGIPDTSGSALDALTSAITALNAGSTTPESVQLANINASQLAQQEQAGTSVFQTLIKSLNAHQGLGRISASIPGLGDVSTWYGKPTITKTITQPARLKFTKGSSTLTTLASNTARINNLIKRGYRAA